MDLFGNVDELINVSNNSLEISLSETSASHGWSTNTKTAWSQSRLVSRNGVLVASHVGVFENSLDTGTIKSLGAEIKEDHVRVGTTGNKSVSQLLEFLFTGLGVLDDLLLVLLEFWSEGLSQSDGKGGDGVVVWTSLVTWEDGEVDGILELVESLLALGVSGSNSLSEEDHGTTGST